MVVGIVSFVCHPSLVFSICLLPSSHSPLTPLLTPLIPLYLPSHHLYRGLPLGSAAPVPRAPSLPPPCKPLSLSLLHSNTSANLSLPPLLQQVLNLVPATLQGAKVTARGVLSHLKR